MATCPECDAELEIEDDDRDEMEVGDPWDCEACGTRLRVSNVEPLEFDNDDDDEDEDDEKSDDEESDDLDDEDEDEDGDDEDGDWDE
jgi:DNA-directed RNA polymerase subunit M/transcription elongation factor TFIIS